MHTLFVHWGGEVPGDKKSGSFLTPVARAQAQPEREKTPGATAALKSIPEKLMSLFALDDSEKRNVPAKRARDYAFWRRQLHTFNPTAENQIRAALNQVFDRAAANQETVYSSAIPGKDWTGNVYDPIYQCLQDENQARLFFGLLVWDVAVHRDEDWYFKPKDQDETEAGTYYFLRGQ